MMKRVVVVACALACAAALVAGDFCHGKPSANAKPNVFPILDSSTISTLMRTAPNNTGKAYQVGTGPEAFWLLHVYGTPYEMGYAHGYMMRQEATTMMNLTMAYLEEQVQQALNGWPTWLRDWVSVVGLDFALDLTASWTKAYTGEYFFQEMQGLADGAGIDYQTLLRVHMLPELTKAACSMYGAWGGATAATGHTMQLRALDWDTDGPFRDFPAVVVYHPSSGGHAFANVGFIGWIGALTGQSEAQMAISEIGVSFPDLTFGNESRIGVPFHFLLRDILQFDQTLNDSIARIENAHRTCDLILGVGDGKAEAETMRGFQYSASVANVISDQHFLPVNSTWHAPIEHVVYFGMDWLCPGYNEALGNQLRSLWGKINMENTVSDITAIVQTGNLHIAVYDLTAEEMAVSFCKRSWDNSTAPMYAYDRQFVKLDLQALFAETA